MSKKTRHKRSCSRKRRLCTKRYAKQTASVMSRVHGHPFDHYKCTHCGFYHVGKAKVQS